jgi:hypothetical protein
VCVDFSFAERANGVTDPHSAPIKVAAHQGIGFHPWSTKLLRFIGCHLFQSSIFGFHGSFGLIHGLKGVYAVFEYDPDSQITAVVPSSLEPSFFPFAR